MSSCAYCTGSRWLMDDEANGPCVCVETPPLAPTPVINDPPLHPDRKTLGAAWVKAQKAWANCNSAKVEDHIKAGEDMFYAAANLIEDGDYQLQAADTELATLKAQLTTVTVEPAETLGADGKLEAAQAEASILKAQLTTANEKAGKYADELAEADETIAEALANLQAYFVSIGWPADPVRIEQPQLAIVYDQLSQWEPGRDEA